MSAGHPIYDNRQAAAAHQLGRIIDAVDAARAAEAAEPKVWHFASSADARAAIDQDQVADGDVLVVESERVVAFVSGVWPVAITEQCGAFASYDKLGKPARAYCAGSYIPSVERAEQAAIELGYTLADPAARITAGRPVPIEVPRLLVQPGDILHAFGARLRVVDTGTRISLESSRAEWWALVEGATEEDRRRTYRSRWTLAVPVALAAWDVVTVERNLSSSHAQAGEESADGR
ncbi:hypothetical protein ACFOOM_01105 [Streptomyces echinoruber]|uniref:Uncharacterized protein n=1 Tax=Streptomyces echinoruber TaxID=68898 RepID=A0A918QVX6_9ACTN|nr:hypothetical protein [Streptomyces echinoruber]GGZ73070.1 hypothetical protein GCM10010389_08130 [Streptomyces echinoruber]